MEGGKEREQTWGSAFLRVEGVVPRVLWVHSLWMNLKQESRNYSTEREKQALKPEL